MIRNHWDYDDEPSTPPQATTAPPATPHTTTGVCGGCDAERPSDEQIAAEQWDHLRKYYVNGDGQ